MVFKYKLNDGDDHAHFGSNPINLSYKISFSSPHKNFIRLALHLLMTLLPERINKEIQSKSLKKFDLICYQVLVVDVIIVFSFAVEIMLNIFTSNKLILFDKFSNKYIRRPREQLFHFRYAKRFVISDQFPIFLRSFCEIEFQSKTQ